MPAVDRNLLRIGVFEMLWVDEIDDPVAITEAVEAALDALDGRLAPASSTAAPEPHRGSGRLPARRPLTPA